MAQALHKYRSTTALFAVLVVGAVVFLWISRATQFHQLAIGILLSLITLSLALTLFELCWCAGLFVTRLFVLALRHRLRRFGF